MWGSEAGRTKKNTGGMSAQHSGMASAQTACRHLSAAIMNVNKLEEAVDFFFFGQREI